MFDFFIGFEALVREIQGKVKKRFLCLTIVHFDDVGNRTKNIYNINIFRGR